MNAIIWCKDGSLSPVLTALVSANHSLKQAGRPKRHSAAALTPFWTAAHGVNATIWCKDGSLSALNAAGAFHGPPYLLPSGAVLGGYVPDWTLPTAKIDFQYASGAAF